MEVKEKKVIPFGRWPSPITPELITKGVKQFVSVALDGEEIYWGEMRPSEKGRTVIVHKGRDITPSDFNVRTRVHEYGGAPFTVHNGTIYFINFRDQRLYKQKPGEKPRALTSEGAPRFADMHVSRQGIYAVAEQHKTGEEPENFIALIEPNTGEFRKIVTGHDFFSSPIPDGDNTRLAWVSWDHPNMPWDTTELWIGDIGEDGQISHAARISGGKNESVINPKWAPDGSLYFISDKSGWWNLYRWRDGATDPVFPMEAEFGGPQWVFGMSSYDIVGEKILAAYREGASSKLAIIDPATKTKKDFDLPETSFALIHVHADFAVFAAGSPTIDPEIIQLNLTNGLREVIARNEKVNIDTEYYSIPKHIPFPSANGRTAYGYYYPPQNKEYRGPEGELPPLIVKTHGGPTSNTSNVFNLKTQYWTSRGFAVLDVDYGGSAGYGRRYRELLKGMWGIVDREDVEHGARYLVEKGLVHPKKLAITGGSAGGYTTLNALTFGNVFHVGASYYGVSDLELLAKETHKFESRYLDGLIGPYPEMKALYIERSPLHFPERIKTPIIFFQGLEDPIVLPNQAEILFQSLKKQRLLTRLVTYEGEQHGFRQEKNIQDSLIKELEFYLEAFEPIYTARE